ncbi:hypothetical protein T492DRAFT_831329 [Pavlovales sp. CCMP2436]|nr:hypothetical protein T492DRAFT_831329 [Pavlovales sp. CCMP2436]
MDKIYPTPRLWLTGGGDKRLHLACRVRLVTAQFLWLMAFGAYSPLAAMITRRAHAALPQPPLALATAGAAGGGPAGSGRAAARAGGGGAHICGAAESAQRVFQRIVLRIRLTVRLLTNRYYVPTPDQVTASLPAGKLISAMVARAERGAHTPARWRALLLQEEPRTQQWGLELRGLRQGVHRVQKADERLQREERRLAAQRALPVEHGGVRRAGAVVDVDGCRVEFLKAAEFGKSERSVGHGASLECASSARAGHTRLGDVRQREELGLEPLAVRRAAIVGSDASAPGGSGAALAARGGLLRSQALDVVFLPRKQRTIITKPSISTKCARARPIALIDKWDWSNGNDTPPCRTAVLPVPGSSMAHNMRGTRTLTASPTGDRILEDDGSEAREDGEGPNAPRPCRWEWSSNRRRLQADRPPRAPYRTRRYLRERGFAKQRPDPGKESKSGQVASFPSESRRAHPRALRKEDGTTDTTNPTYRFVGLVYKINR